MKSQRNSSKRRSTLAIFSTSLSAGASSEGTGAVLDAANREQRRLDGVPVERRQAELGCSLRPLSGYFVQRAALGLRLVADRRRVRRATLLCCHVPAPFTPAERQRRDAKLERGTSSRELVHLLAAAVILGHHPASGGRLFRICHLSFRER